jgi:Fic family protein
MKKPRTPPNTNTLMSQIFGNKDGPEKILGANLGTHAHGKYLHWDKLRHCSPPKGFSHEEWWLALKIKRRGLYKQIPLFGKKKKPFVYLVSDPIPEILHEIDQGAGGFIRMPSQIINSETRDQYYVNSIIREAITSSQLEGAVTTRKIAKDMIRIGRPPHDRSEQMIFNNYKTMQRIGKIKDKSLSKKLVFEIHELITNKTLDDPSATKRFRKPDERIVVSDMYNEVFHDPPPANELEKRQDDMCNFANGKIPGTFVHPVIRSIILHFWLAYDHPFTDGNGRTARALFYWSMLRNNFWLFEFVSISQIILNAPVKYARSFLYTETDDNDLTYFIIYHLQVIQRAISELHRYIKHKTLQLQKMEGKLRGVITLNHRQRMLISHALRHPHQHYTIKGHQTSHNVVYQTSRYDLFDLEDRKLLKSSKVGRTLYFTPTSDLEEKLIKIG